MTEDRQIHLHTDQFRRARLEIEGVEIKVVASNIRIGNIDWQSVRLVSGTGNEGSIVLVEALSSFGSTVHVEDQQGRDQRIHQGDKFLGVLANRHSGTSESGGIPADGIDINPDQELHLLSTGGIVGINTGIPRMMRQEPLRLMPLGLIANSDGKPIDLIEQFGGHHERLNGSAPIIIVCGTSAEVGKTTTSAALIRALKERGLNTGGTKFAGTGRMRDILSFNDAGAFPWMDFPDVGLPTTYTSAERFTKGMYTLFNLLNSGNPKPDVIVAEAGGDPIEANIPTFLSNQSLMRNVRSIVIVSGDVMGMIGTVDYLRRFTNAPLFLTDPKDRNPVSTRERVRQELPEIPIFNPLNAIEVANITSQIT